MNVKYFKQLKVKVQHDPENQEFYIPASPDKASVSYEVSEDVWELTEVSVPQELRKLNMGASLMEYTLEKAKKEKVNVLPKCTYAEQFIAKHPRYQGLLPSEA